MIGRVALANALDIGVGYAPHKFLVFYLRVSRRVSLTDESLAVLQRAFAGEHSASKALHISET